ncbi:cysteine hydrolase [Patescibacteria group bacterium]|nr:cysteine hydrolase [Patescibacteria group bacterium]
MTLNPLETLLLVIDVQVDFCSPEGLSATRGRGMHQITEMLPRLLTFIPMVKEKGVSVVYTQMITTEHPPENYILARKVKGFEDIARVGTHGAELYMVIPEQDDVVIVKERFDAFAGTTLATLCAERKIRNILITGVRSDICVDATAKRAFAEGYNVFVVKDLVATSDERLKQHEVILETFGTYSGFVISSKEAEQSLSSTDSQ